MKSLLKKLMIIACFFYFAPYGLCETCKGPAVYSLSVDEAVALAFKNNKDIRIQEEEVSAARAAIVGERSGFLPKLNAVAEYTHSGSVLALSQAQGTKKDVGIFTGYKNDNKAGLQLEQDIFNGGANTVNLRQAQVKLKIQEETLRARKLDTGFEVKRLYYGLLLAHEAERIAQNLLGQAKSHYEEVKKFASFKPEAF